jgi:hypothetical protein
VKAPRFLSLDTAKRKIRGLFVCQTLLAHMNRELAIVIHKHSNGVDGLASRPQPEFAQAFARQIFTSDPRRESQSHDGHPAT